MTISDDVLTHMPPEPHKTISTRIRDGDLLLCAAHDPFSRLIGWATKSPWTHVAIAYRWPSLGRIMVFEAVQTIGVRAVPLTNFLRQTSSGQKPYPGKIILARHADFAAARGKATSDEARRFADFAVDRFGDKFAAGEIWRIALRVTLGRLDRDTPKFMGPKNAFICSEYVAKCFERVGIKIPWDGRGFIAPADFAADPKIKALGRFRTG
ncbi:MAG TPA: hypothetical protein VKU90_11240 [Caulobacteraceae bacterium]|nr:hypothetical protein [Caulobacteraceae bacterium]